MREKLDGIPANLPMNEYFAEPSIAKLKTKLYPELLDAVTEYISEIFMAYDTNCDIDASLNIAKTMINRFSYLRLVQIKIFALKCIDGDFVNDNNYYLTRPKLLNWFRTFCAIEDQREKQFSKMIEDAKKQQEGNKNVYHPPQELLDEMKAKLGKIGRG